MKVLFCLGEYYKERIGGAEIQSYLLIKELMERGHGIAYVYNGERTTLEPVIDEDGIELYTIERPKAGIKTFHYLHRSDIRKLLDTISPDVIYQRGDYHFLDIMSSYGNKRGIPVFSALSMERHCHQPRIYPTLSLPLQLVNRYLINRYYRRSTVVISQTLPQKNRFRENFSRDSVVIPIGHPVPEDLPEKEQMILWVANIKPIKQPELFIELAKRLKDTGIRFVMIGGPDVRSYQDKIEKLIDSSDNVEYLGRKELDETNDLIARAILLINTSESEGFSNTFVQSWMRGTPVASMNTDPDGLIGENNIGIVESDIERLEVKIRNLIGDPVELQKMSKRSREIALERFDITKVAGKLESLFRSHLK